MVSHLASQRKSNFELYCEFLKFLNQYCDFVRIEDSVEQINSKKVITDCLVSFTVDDGFEECFSIIAPALEKYGTNAAFFVNGGNVNKSEKDIEKSIVNNIMVNAKTIMNWSEISNLHKRGHIIGSHTLDHVNMNSSNHELIDIQLLDNKCLIEEHINHPCEFFAYPYGQFKHINKETLSLAEKYHKYVFSATDYINY
ncbi:unnamed protein product, partial [marine sediment metagenome]